MAAISYLQINWDGEVGTKSISSCPFNGSWHFFSTVHIGNGIAQLGQLLNLAADSTKYATGMPASMGLEYELANLWKIVKTGEKKVHYYTSDADPNQDFGEQLNKILLRTHGIQAAFQIPSTASKYHLHLHTRHSISSLPGPQSSCTVNLTGVACPAA